MWMARWRTRSLWIVIDDNFFYKFVSNGTTRVYEIHKFVGKYIMEQCDALCYSFILKHTLLTIAIMLEMWTLKQRRRTGGNGSTNSSSNIRHRVSSSSVEKSVWCPLFFSLYINEFLYIWVFTLRSFYWKSIPWCLWITWLAPSLTVVYMYVRLKAW